MGHLINMSETLATANRSRVSIRVTKIFGQGKSVVDPVKFPLI